MEASALVIKVKYGDFIRRFNASVTDDKLDLSMSKLIEKICILFDFATDTELTLTYIDEDGDAVTLVDDDDLRDVVEQSLNPLRITVTLNKEKNSSPIICSTGSSTPLSSPRVQPQFQNINSGVSEILKTIPNPLRETLAKLSTDLVSKLSSSAPGITPGTAEIVEYFSKVGLSCLSQISELQARVWSNAQNDVPERRPTVTETKDSDLSKVDPTPLNAQSQGRSKEQLPRNDENSPKLKSVATMVDPTPFKAQSHGGSKKQLPRNNENSPKLKSVATMADPTPLKAQSQGGSKKQLPQNDENSPKLKSVATMKIHDVKVSASEGSMEASSSKAPGINSVARSIKDVNKNHRGMEVNPGVSKLDSCFIVDVTMIDGTIITPLTPFTKIWCMRNNGTLVWPEKTRLVWIGGDKLSNSFSVELQVPAAGLAVNQEFDVAVDFISPKLPGRYVSYWRMAAPSGQIFGQRVWVHIQVHATIEKTLHGVRGLNLNLPLVNNVLTGPKVDNAVMDPLVEDSHPEEVFEPITPFPNIEQHMEFTISDSSMVGSGATNLAPTAHSSIVYPVIDQSDMASPVYHPPYVHHPFLYTQPAPPVFYPLPPTPPSLLYPPPPHMFYPPPPPPVTFPPHPSSPYTLPSPPLYNSWPPPVGDTLENTEELQGMEEVEEELLRKLEEMGFNQVDLNKQILRFHEYDLAKTLKDLCESTLCGIISMRSSRK